MNIFKKLINLLCRIRRRLKVYWKRIYWTPERIHNCGNQLLSEIDQKRPNNSTFVYAGPFMGDALYAMAFVEEYKHQHPDRVVIILTSTRAAENLVKTFKGYDRVVLLTKRQNIILQGMFGDIERAVLAKQESIFKLPEHPAYSVEYPNVMDRLRYLIFEVGEKAPIHYHQLTPQKVTCIPDFYERCGKIVVLNPYSNSSHLSQKELRTFEKLVHHLHTMEYMVFTNVINDQLSIFGTMELRCGLAEFLEIANYVPFIISVRSGILDFVVKTNVNMLVIYPSEGVISKNSFGMGKWKCDGIIKEITYDEFFKDENLESVDKFINDVNANKVMND